LFGERLIDHHIRVADTNDAAFFDKFGKYAFADEAGLLRVSTGSESILARRNVQSGVEDTSDHACTKRRVKLEIH